MVNPVSAANAVSHDETTATVQITATQTAANGAEIKTSTPQDQVTISEAARQAQDDGNRSSNSGAVRNVGYDGGTA
jgi:hypothetical protein